MGLLYETDGGIKIYYFPPCAPELNPIGPQRKVHKKTTENRTYENVEEM